jgi:hypothetical protein
LFGLNMSTSLYKLMLIRRQNLQRTMACGLEAGMKGH